MSYFDSDSEEVMTQDEYYELAWSSVNESAYNLRNIDAGELTQEQYYNIVRRVIVDNKNYDVWDCIDTFALSSDQCFELFDFIIQEAPYHVVSALKEDELIDVSILSERQLYILATRIVLRQAGPDDYFDILLKIIDEDVECLGKNDPDFSKLNMAIQKLSPDARAKFVEKFKVKNVMELMEFLYSPSDTCEVEDCETSEERLASEEETTEGCKKLKLSE